MKKLIILLFMFCFLLAAEYAYLQIKVDQKLAELNETQKDIFIEIDDIELQVMDVSILIEHKKSNSRQTMLLAAK